MEQTAILGIDLGGTKISGAIFNSSGIRLSKEKILIHQRQGEQVAGLIVNLISVLQERCKDLGLMLTGIGIAVPGIYYQQTGTVWAPNIPGWESFALFQHLRENMDPEIKVAIDNDRACYILGETWKGAAVGCKHAIFMAVGTGIGAGILVNGSILRGQSDIAGAIGWMALTDHFMPPYNHHGCFEHHASGNGIAWVANEHTKQKLTAEEVFELHAQGDPMAVSVIEQAIIYWGKATANLVSLFNPEIIIFGGGVFGPALEFLPEIYQEATRWAQPVSIKEVQFLKSSLGSEAGLYGAASLVKDYTNR